MKKLRLDPDALRVDTFDPAFSDEDAGTVYGGQVGPTLSCGGSCLTCVSCAQTCGQSCYLTCPFTCYRTCQGSTCFLTCELTCPRTCAHSCFTCDPFQCGEPTGPVCG